MSINFPTKGIHFVLGNTRFLLFFRASLSLGVKEWPETERRLRDPLEEGLLYSDIKLEVDKQEP